MLNLHILTSGGLRWETRHHVMRWHVQSTALQHLPLQVVRQGGTERIGTARRVKAAGVEAPAALLSTTGILAPAPLSPTAPVVVMVSPRAMARSIIASDHDWWGPIHHGRGGHHHGCRIWCQDTFSKVGSNLSCT